MTSTERKRARSPHQPVGRWIRADKRLAIYVRDAFTCLACGAPLRARAPAEITLDHITARARGGTNHAANLYTCCRACNSTRGARTLAATYPRDAVARIRAQARRSLRRHLAIARELMA